ncbi:MAG TPA: L,D-transpeptidase family protein [Desulfuromonadaceae bacterium]|nr:L,D-transpeptidase family protein [Desulfuromonadaceae bacterium]
MKRFYLIAIVLAASTTGYFFRPYLWAAISPVAMKFTKSKTVAERLDQYGTTARARWKPLFDEAGVAYPPHGVTLVALKQERMLEVYASDNSGKPRRIRTYKILAASGHAGPKLREGDGQVPEGIYAVESLNPNSRFHLALHIGYPNSFDREQATQDGRSQLGGDIMIHGSSVSVGCLAMGDEAAEDLFVLTADTGLPNTKVIISPVDFRNGKSVPHADLLPKWTASLYSQIRNELSILPAPSK